MWLAAVSSADGIFGRVPTCRRLFLYFVFFLTCPSSFTEAFLLDLCMQLILEFNSWLSTAGRFSSGRQQQKNTRRRFLFLLPFNDSNRFQLEQFNV